MTIRQSDIARAIRGVHATGLEVERVEVTAGGVIVYTRREAAEPPAEGQGDDAAEWLRANAPDG